MTKQELLDLSRVQVNDLKDTLVRLMNSEAEPIHHYDEKEVVWLTRDYAEELLRSVNANGLHGCLLCQG